MRGESPGPLQLLLALERALVELLRFAVCRINLQRRSQVRLGFGIEAEGPIGVAQRGAHGTEVALEPLGERVAADAQLVEIGHGRTRVLGQHQEAGPQHGELA